jgi:hypothetical protein
MFSWDKRQARITLLLFLAIFAAGQVKAYLTRPIYPDPAAHRELWPPGECLVDATALKGRALEVFERGTTIAEAVRRLNLAPDPLGSGFCLSRAGILYRGKEGWRIRPMSQQERWVWRIPMALYSCEPEDLERISGIGPHLSGKIHRYVQENRYLRSIKDLDRIPGVGPVRLKTLMEELDLN